MPSTTFRFIHHLRLAVLTLCLSFCASLQLQSSPRYSYTHYTELDGLSYGRATDIKQGPDGRIWIATWNGLNLFDGYHFTTYKDATNHETSMLRNRIDLIEISPRNNVWCLANNRLFLYVSKQDTFLNIGYLLDTLVIDPYFIRMALDADSALWVLDQSRTAYKIDEAKLLAGASHWAERYTDSESAPHSLYTNPSHWHPDMNHDPKFLEAMQAAGIHKPLYFEGPDHQLILIDEDCRAWYYNPQTQQFEFMPLPIDRDTKLRKVLQDRQGNLWIYGTKSEIGKLTFFDELFDVEPLGNCGNEVRAMMIDPHQRLWISCKGGYIRIYDLQTKQLQGYLSRSGRIQSTPVVFEPDMGAYSFYNDTLRHCIWMGMKQRGLFRLKPAMMASSGSQMPMNYHIDQFTHHDNDSYSLSSDDVYCVSGDSHGRIWIGTYGGGINYIDEPLAQSPRFIHQGNLIGQTAKEQPLQVRCMMQVGDVMLVGAVNGLYSFSLDFKQPGQITMFRNAKELRTQFNLSDNDITSLYATPGGTLYLTTFTGGLNRIEPSGTLLTDSLRFRSFTMKHGAISDVTMGITADANQCLWMTSDHTLMRFDPSSETFENFNSVHFGQETTFSEAIPLQLPDSMLLVGTTQGNLLINPMLTTNHHYTVPLLITEVMVNEQRHTACDTLTLAPDERSVHFSFVAVDYQSASPIQYAYRLDDVDTDWHYTTDLRSANYVHLHAGSYRFRVRSTNRFGVWLPHEATCTIVCRPTFAETPWATLLYIVLVLLFVGIAVGIALHIYRLRNVLLMEQKMSKMKQQFFTEASHNLRTPLTLIGNPVSEVLNHVELSEPYKGYLLTVRNNAERMLELLDKMLSFFAKPQTLTSDAPTHIDYEHVQSVIPTEPDDDPHTTDRSVLLIVEDNPELRSFLTSIFHGEYELLTACNGQEGLDKAIESIPDLILTDLTMPVMDGMEMIGRLRNHPDTSHIPIVALTARVSVEDQMRGSQLGVRLYVTKPFNATLLRIQIATLIQEQSELQVWALKQLSEKSDEPQPEEAQSEGAQPAVAAPAPYVSQYDRQFLEKLKETFLAHLSDCEYDMENLSDDLAMSRSNLSRKCKVLTGQSPAALFQEIRLQKAMDLINEGIDRTIDLAAMVGYSDSRYFGRCFKKVYGQTPSEVIKNRQPHSMETPL